MIKNPVSLRLILGDQLNIKHPWFDKIDHQVLFVLMEVKSESEYVMHHIQKVVGIFDAMRNFSNKLTKLGHQVLYIKINDAENKHDFIQNILFIAKKWNISEIHYQQPDEYRLDLILGELKNTIQIPVVVSDTHHFLTKRNELKDFFHGKKRYTLEYFYRHLRKRHRILMSDDNHPLMDKWNFDQENRNKVPKNHNISTTSIQEKDVSLLVHEIKKSGIKTIGEIQVTKFSWTTTREDALDLLEEFIEKSLPLFGTLQDAMLKEHWYLYHSRLSFALNIKLISPLEAIKRIELAYHESPNKYAINQIEGFIRQILGWREYMRGIYWAEMPSFSKLNFFQHNQKLPHWFWNGKTKMNCLKHAIDQTLKNAYAHHIQRLMITGNFALLAGISPDDLDNWYLGVYIDAFEWVEITNTRGMSQFADGGIVGTKPYVSSGSYINKMSNYCESCFYKIKLKTEENACPFNSLYWAFIDKNEEYFSKNPRSSMILNVWKKMSQVDKESILYRSQQVLNQIEHL